MPKSLVTGGAGFIGSHVCDALLAAGHEIVVLDDLSGGFEENVPRAARLVVGDVSDETVVGRIFRDEPFDYVFHLAAYAAEGLSHFIKRFNYRNNLIGTVNLINAAVNRGTVKGFVFTSSIAVYGSGQLPMTEDMTPRPEDSYGIAKCAAEMELRISHEIFGLPYIVFRPHNVYGERQNIGDKYRNVIGIFLNQILQGRPLTIFGDGEQTRAFTHIDDVAPVIARSIERPEAWGETFNVGADRPYTVNELAETVCRAMDVRPDIRRLPARLEVKHAYASHDKVRRMFGDLVRGVSLEEGVGSMAAWAREHGSRKSRDFADLEIRKNLPPSWLE
jgi:UDP-glucose 4-epimerase